MADCCSGGTTLLYSCSGAADVGCIADRVTRDLALTGAGRMTCLAGIGAGLSGFVASARGAEMNITIDGCPLGCARKGLEAAGVTPQAFVLTDFGLVKGETPVTAEIVATMAANIRDKIYKRDTEIVTVTGSISGDDNSPCW